MTTIGIIMRCLMEEEWPSESFKSYVRTRDDPITEESVLFTCPAGHKFTLKQALVKGIFTEEDANKLISQAKKLKEQCTGNRAWQASDYIPSKEIAALNIPCVRCGEKAEWSPKGLKDMVKRKRLALCLKCRADWGNYDNKESFNFLTWGKASDLFWEAIFGRFINNLPALDRSGAEKLLIECRKKVREISSRRPH